MACSVTTMRELLRSLLEASELADPGAGAAAAFGALIAAASFGIAVFDAELAVVAVNESFVAAVGNEVQLHRPLADAFPGGAELLPVLGQILETGVARRDVPWRGRICHCHPIRIASRIAGVVCILDEDRGRLARAERDEARAGERLARAALEDAVRFEDRLFAAMSHELRAPVATMHVWDKALRDNPEDAALRDQALAAIRHSTAAQMQLFDALLDLGRTRRGKLPLELRLLDLQDELTAAIERIRGTAAAKSLTLEVRGQSRLGMINGDRNRIRQVLDQLLSNAVKFTGPGGRIVVTTHRAGDMVEIEVADTGAGIAPELLPHVLEPFLGAGDSYRSGLGVGLALARAIVEAHGGTLKTRSDGPGRGSTFAVTLPGARTAAALPLAAIPPNLRDRRVLLVDDDHDALEGLAILLGDAGADVET